MIDPRIFREYDIRGVWGKDLTGDAVREIGRAFARYLRKRSGTDDRRTTVTVGRDVRLSSPDLFNDLAGGLTAAGVDVIDIGECPTPLQYFSLHHLSVDGGIMITGSHNPPEFNGLKLSVGTETLYGEAIQELKRMAERADGPEGSGKISRYRIIPEYSSHVRSLFSGFEPVSVVVDAGNGTGGMVAPALLRELGCEVTELYCEPDGRFPNHHPDPVVPENIKDLACAVKAKKAHFGIGFDGDADRIGVVDEQGEAVWGDRLLILFAREILEHHPGATVIGEVKCSETLFDDVRRRGGNPVMWKVGHSRIKNKMKETGALLAGEMSGHIFFRDRYFGYDDAIYAALRLAEIVSKKGKPYSLRSLLSDVPLTVSTPEIRIDCPDDTKFSVIERARGLFSSYDVTDIDGLRIRFEDGWGLIRASNTQPALVLRFEAGDEGSLKRIRRIIEEGLKRLL